MRVQHAILGLLVAFACAERLDNGRALFIRQAEIATNTQESTPSNTNDGDAESSPAPTTGSVASTRPDSDEARPTSTQVDDATSAITVTPTGASGPVPTGDNLLPNLERDHEALPIQPKLTPALGIAGAILIVVGLALGFVGIKHRPTQTFLSTSLLIALGIEVLVIYLMHPPVSDAVQGAFLIAGVVGGCALGALALIFKEMSEGFGCVLGGFCLAMWLLVLAPGGLITNQVGRIILIGLLSAAGFCLYISRWTRIYGIIFCTSFAGAYAFILGVDCFSGAGLKEFWLYIWALNEDVFPLYTDTYPINRNMRAEIAAVIILAFFGIMSQIKIWKIVKEQKAKRDAERLREQEERHAEEAELGRDIESQVARDRSRWEVDYDGKKEATIAVHPVTDPEKPSSIDGYDTSSPHVDNRRYSLPMAALRPSSRNSIGRSPSNVSNWNNSRPSLSPFGLNVDSDNNRPPSTVYTTETPGMGRSNAGSQFSSSVSLIKEKPIASVKRLSVASLAAHEMLEENEDPEFVDEVEDDVASSIAATLADAPDMDALSITLSRPASMYLSQSPDEAPVQPQEEFTEEADDEALYLPSQSPEPVSGTPRAAQSRQSSYLPDGAAAEDTEKVELKEKLPRRISKAASNYRTNEWAKEVSRAEPVPMEEEEEHTSDAVQIETANAATAARAGENNAAPVPTPPPTPPPVLKSKKKEQRRSSQHRLSTSRMPTPVYSHGTKQQDEEWDVPLAKRLASNLATNNLVASIERAQSISTPLQDQQLGSRPASRAKSPILQTPAMPQNIHRTGARDRLSSNRLSQMPMLRSSSSMSNLLDQRQDRIENRLTTTSFMIPAPVMATVPETSSTDETVHGDSSLGQQRSNTSVSGGDRSPSMVDVIDEEDMTLAERKVLVQRQSSLNLQNATYPTQPSTSRRRSSGAITPDPFYNSNQATMSQIMLGSPSRRLSTAMAANQPQYDPHQSRRTSSHNANKQAQIWSQWRNSNTVAPTQQPTFQTDTQMDMLRAARIQSEKEAKMREQQRREMQEQMDQHMRMGGMHDAHRAALSRMQGQVSKKV